MSKAIHGIPGELVGGWQTKAPVWPVPVVVEQPVVHGYLDVVVVVEVPAVGKLAPEARVEALDGPVLPGVAGLDVDSLDGLVGE
jgi:hypothetical protein